MSILANKNTRVLCQGIMSTDGLRYTEQAIAYGTVIVGGVAPDHGGETLLGVPLFNSVKEAVRKTKPQASVIFAQAQSAYDEIYAAIKAKIPLIICTTERMPVHDMFKLLPLLKKSSSRLIGPASPGLVTAEECMLGTMPAHLFPAGNVGIITRSGSLLYEAIQQLSRKGLGVSSCVALGAYPVLGTNYTDIFDLFQKDVHTDAILLIGEIGGDFEIKMAQSYKRRTKKKPLITYIAGRQVPSQTYMGNIGAIVIHPTDSATYKLDKLKQAGAVIVESPADIGKTVHKVLTPRRK